jgi:hypothetical protein
MSAIVLRAQPHGSRLLVYGGLSLQSSQADPASLIFEGKRLEVTAPSYQSRRPSHLNWVG